MPRHMRVSSQEGMSSHVWLSCLTLNYPRPEVVGAGRFRVAVSGLFVLVSLINLDSINLLSSLIFSVDLSISRFSRAPLQ